VGIFFAAYVVAQINYWVHVTITRIYSKAAAKNNLIYDGKLSSKADYAEKIVQTGIAIFAPTLAYYLWGLFI